VVTFGHATATPFDLPLLKTPRCTQT